MKLNTVLQLYGLNITKKWTCVEQRRIAKQLAIDKVPVNPKAIIRNCPMPGWLTGTARPTAAVKFDF